VVDNQAENGPESPGRTWRERLHQRPMGSLPVSIGAGLFVVFLAVVGLAVASQPSTTAKAKPTSPVPLTTSRPSPIEGMPVPKQASLDVPVASSQAKSAIYTVPARPSVIASWYELHLTKGRPWHGWRWVGESQTCNGYFKGESAVWQWERSGQTLTIYVYRSLSYPRIGAVTIQIDKQLPLCGVG
jgi:hypothetical protein